MFSPPSEQLLLYYLLSRKLFWIKFLCGNSVGSQWNTFFRVNVVLYKLFGWLVRPLCFLKSLRQTFLQLPALLHQPFNESQGKMLKMKALTEDVRGWALIKLHRILSNIPTAAYTCTAVLYYTLPGVTCLMPNLNLHFNAFIFIANALSPKRFDVNLFTSREHRTKLRAIHSSN